MKVSHLEIQIVVNYILKKKSFSKYLDMYYTVCSALNTLYRHLQVKDLLEYAPSTHDGAY